MFRVFVAVVPLLLAACQAPQPFVSETSADAVRIQYNGATNNDAVFNTAKEACSAYGKKPVLVGSRYLEAISINRESLFRCE